MDLHFESKSDSFVACVHLICQPLSFVVGTSGWINHNIIKAHDLVTQFVLCISQPMELFSSYFLIYQFLAVSYFYYHQLFNLSHSLVTPMKPSLERSKKRKNILLHSFYIHYFTQYSQLMRCTHFKKQKGIVLVLKTWKWIWKSRCKNYQCPRKM